MICVAQRSKETEALHPYHFMLIFHFLWPYGKIPSCFIFHFLFLSFFFLSLSI